MLYDAIVCGAGPSGSFCARNLSEKGLNVLLLEAKTLPRYKVCSGWITQGVFDLLGLNPSKVEFPIIPTSKLIFYSNRLEGIEMTYDGKPVTFGTSRKWFDFALAKKAEENGVTLLDNSKVRDVKIGKDKVIVSTKEKYESKIVVGADGAYSKVALSLKVRKHFKPSEVWLCTCSETDLNANKGEEGVAHLIFADFDTGYYWFYPKQDKLNFGVATSLEFIMNKARAEKKSNALVSHELFINSKKYFTKLDLLNTSVQLEPERSYLNPSLYNLNTKKYKMCGPRFILVGDTIGASNPLSGEGIFQGMLTSKIASEQIIKALDSDNYSFDEYENLILSVLEKEHKTAEATRRMIKPTRPEFDAYLAMLRSDRNLQKSILEALFGLKRIKFEIF
jgi:geranylgeranyl reductase family protein